MHLTAFFLADHAEAIGGKLYVMGGCWTTLNVSRLPATHPHMSVCVALEVPWHLMDAQHTLELRLVDADGRDLVPHPLQAQFEARRHPAMRPGDSATLVVVLNVDNLTVQQAGRYEWVLAVDGEPLGRAPFAVQLAQAPAR